ncbi:hypothetical protein ONS96_005272 [Cadophora gregata f. sp. sojae]|nr:hypothetical protein ONS96_005272 [Cadophora gregata f. sp. sojae]
MARKPLLALTAKDPMLFHMLEHPGVSATRLLQLMEDPELLSLPPPLEMEVLLESPVRLLPLPLMRNMVSYPQPSFIGLVKRKQMTSCSDSDELWILRDTIAEIQFYFRESQDNFKSLWAREKDMWYVHITNLPPSSGPEWSFTIRDFRLQKMCIVRGAYEKAVQELAHVGDAILSEDAHHELITLKEQVEALKAFAG